MNKSFKYKHTIGKESTYPKDMPSEHSNLPVWNSENWFYEDVIIDHKIRSLRRTISEGEAMQFNCMVLDMHPYVGDEHFAKKEGLFQKRLVAGAMVFSYGLGLVATNCVNSFSYGYDRLRFIKPVFIGDTIYTIRTINNKSNYNDDRVTILNKINSKVFTILSGKWNTSVAISKNIKENLYK